MAGYGNYEAFTDYDFANSNIGTGNSKTLDDLSSQWSDYINKVNNYNFPGNLPKFEYNPQTGDTDVTNKNETYRQKNREDLLFNESLDQRDALFKRGINSAIDLETRMRNAQDYQQKLMMDNQKAVADKELNRPRTQSFSTSSVLDPNSAEGQKISTWQNINSRNAAYGQGLMNDAEVSKQSLLIPMQTQATIQTQAPQFKSQETVAKTNADAQKAVALASQYAQMYGADANKQASMYGSDTTLKAADVNAQVQKAIADANRQAQMYGANMSAMSSMFGSQMGAVGNMFGGMNVGGGAKYW